MKLFPATANPRALEEIASRVYESPTLREDREEAAAEYRAGRAAQFAEDAFEECTDLDVHKWHAKDEQRDDVLSLAIACIQQDDDLRRDALKELLSRYIDEQSNTYMDAVLREEERDREDAEYSRWEARHAR